jgi:hypothetical protein
MVVKNKSDDPMGSKEEFKTAIKQNKPFKDRHAVKEKTNGRPEWSFKAPSYDNRTSGSIPGGDYYGVGITQPTGKFKAAPISEGPIPQSTKQFSPNEIFTYEDKKG